MKFFEKVDIPPPAAFLLKGVVVRLPNTPYKFVESDPDRPSLGLLCMVASSEAPVYVDTDPKQHAHARYVIQGDFVDIRKTVTYSKEGQTVAYTLERNVSLHDDCIRQRGILMGVLGRPVEA
jgi:hypothetical protein